MLDPSNELLHDQVFVLSFSPPTITESSEGLYLKLFFLTSNKTARGMQANQADSIPALSLVPVLIKKKKKKNGNEKKDNLEIVLI